MTLHKFTVVTLQSLQRCDATEIHWSDATEIHLSDATEIQSRDATEMQSSDAALNIFLFENVAASRSNIFACYDDLFRERARNALNDFSKKLSRHVLAFYILAIVLGKGECTVHWRLSGKCNWFRELDVGGSTPSFKIEYKIY